MGCSRRFDDATEREIYNAYRDGGTCASLADQYSCSDSTISSIVRRHDTKNGVITPRHKGYTAPRRFDHDTERVIYAAYRDGEPSISLAAKYDCNRSTIMNILSRCDAEDCVKTPRHFNRCKNRRKRSVSVKRSKLLDRGRLSYKLSNKQAIGMYVARRKGASWRQLAEQYCVSVYCVRQITKRVEEAARLQGLKV